MKPIKYLLLFCITLFFITCSSIITSPGIHLGVTALGWGSLALRWLFKSDYTFRTISESGILVSLVMTRTGVENSTVVYYGSFGMDLNKMWTEPMGSMFNKPKSLIDSSDISIDFGGLRARAGQGEYFDPVDLDKSGILTVFTNWISDTVAVYGLAPSHSYCNFNVITPRMLQDDWCDNTSHDTACITQIRRGVDEGFKDMCLLVKYTPTVPLD